MYAKILAPLSRPSLPYPDLNSPFFFTKTPFLSSLSPSLHTPLLSPPISTTWGLRIRPNRFRTPCSSPNQELLNETPDIIDQNERNSEGKSNESNSGFIPLSGGEEDEVLEIKGGELANQGMWGQMKEIAKFTGPAAGLWICGPLMSLIDTAVIGQGSSVELAALGIVEKIGHFEILSFANLEVIQWLQCSLHLWRLFD